jgi:1-acyl-sn-glycerol-3-phosphate acyltransferase
MQQDLFHSRRNSFLYGLMRPWVRAGVWLYHDRIEVGGRQHIPKDGPVLLVANHQNAMLDPVLLCVLMDRQLHWLTRADVFRNKWVRRILYQFNMMPVYRERDRSRVPDWSERNRYTFDTCYRRWKQGAAVALFPEGTHRGKKQLHVPLKKGAARLLLGAPRAGVVIDRITIVPVGIDYSEFYRARGRVIVSIGKPIRVGELIAAYQLDEARGSAVITDLIEEALSREMVNIRAGHDYDEYLGIRGLCESISRSGSSYGKMHDYLHVLDYLHNKAEDQEKQLLRDYVHLSAKLKLDESGIAFASRNSLPRATSSFFLLAFFPVYSAARLLWLPFLSLVEWLISTRIRDTLFFNSIRLSFWTFLGPLWLGLVPAVSAILSGKSSAGWITFLIMSFGGILAMRWNSLFHLVRKSRRYRLMMRSHGQEMETWRDLRQQLIQSLRHWNEKSSRPRD